MLMILASIFVTQRGRERCREFFNAVPADFTEGFQKDLRLFRRPEVITAPWVNFLTNPLRMVPFSFSEAKLEKRIVFQTGLTPREMPHSTLGINRQADDGFRCRAPFYCGKRRTRFFASFVSRRWSTALKTRPSDAARPREPN